MFGLFIVSFLTSFSVTLCLRVLSLLSRFYHALRRVPPPLFHSFVVAFRTIEYRHGVTVCVSWDVLFSPFEVKTFRVQL